MKKINKRGVFSVVLSIMLIFTVGFYSSAEHTTAWFTAFGEAAKEFNMDSIDITSDFDGETVELTFDAATKFADEDERNKMFEHACKFFTVTLTNTGDRDALVFLDITEESRAVTADKGVRYYIYEYADTIEYTDVIEVVPGVYENADGKRVIESNGTYFRTDKMIADVLTEKIGGRQAEVESMTSEEQLAFLNQDASSLVELKAGETKSFCCAFWVEYDYFMAVEPIDGIRTLECNVDVVINAVQAEHYPVAEEVSAE
ncbi:MAG: hypothetical protein IJA87_04540 [Clostridia bacterium]|nr:hypothetical protein [Clostridia bacterium]